MNYKRLIKNLQSDEGWRSVPYKDTLGIWTIGFGFTSIDGKRVNEHTPPLTREKGLEILKSLAYKAAEDAQICFPDLNFLDPIRQEVLAEMAYQMGREGLSKFKATLNCIRVGDYKGAARHMRNSLWARQTPARAERAAKRMESGEE